VFVALAWANLSDDVRALAGLSRLSAWQRSHLVAMVLAFSPNSVAAVVVTCCTLQKAALVAGLPVRPGGLGRVSDVLVLAFAMGMGLVYVMPLAAVMVVYGAPGVCFTTCAFARDMLMVPLKVFHWDLQPVWVSVSLSCNLVLAGSLVGLLIAGHVFAFQRAHPNMDAAQRSGGEGVSASKLGAAVRHEVSATIIGCVHELVSSGVWVKGAQAREVETGQEAFLQGPAEAPAEADAEEQDRSILNDPLIASSTCLKVMACIALPMLQVSVVVAAKVYAGQGVWQASEEVFNERSWMHYFGHVQEKGTQAFMPLFWYYL